MNLQKLVKQGQYEIALKVEKQLWESIIKMRKFLAIYFYSFLFNSILVWTPDTNQKMRFEIIRKASNMYTKIK